MALLFPIYFHFLGKRGKSRYFCLALDVQGSAFSFSPFVVGFFFFVMGLPYIVFTMEQDPSTPNSSTVTVSYQDNWSEIVSSCSSDLHFHAGYSWSRNDFPLELLKHISAGLGIYVGGQTPTLHAQDPGSCLQNCSIFLQV